MCGAVLERDRILRERTSHVEQESSRNHDRTGLGDLGVTAEDIDQLSINTLGDACLTTNPRVASQDEISAIFRAAL